MWICPECQRSFQNENQTHSCSPSYNLNSFFKGKKSIWLPFYKQIKDNFINENLFFTEHCPKMGIQWRHNSSFAIFYPKITALEVSFCCDGIDDSIPAHKHMLMSEHRVTHYVHVIDDSMLVKINDWILNSYHMTIK